jgi:hypothetical protein
LAKSVFFSFHYARDHWRIQQVINMGALEGQPILNPQKWEEVKRRGDAAIKKWIEDHMAYKSAVVVLVGAQTAERPWVRYEIAYAWDDHKPLVGIRIHGLADRNGYTDRAGTNPFSRVSLKGGGTVSDYVPLYAPSGSNSQQVYTDIRNNITTWVARAYKRS